MDNNYNNQNGYQQDEQFPQESYPQQNYRQGTYQQPYNQNLRNLDNKATMAMTFGIIGIFFGNIVFGILALVFANACKNAGFKNGRVTAGFVLGIIDLVWCAIGLLLFLLFCGALLVIFAAGSK